MKSRFASAKSNRIKEQPIPGRQQVASPKVDVVAPVLQPTKPDPIPKAAVPKVVKTVEKNGASKARRFKTSLTSHKRGQTITKGSWWSGPGHQYDDDCGCKKPKKPHDDCKDDNKDNGNANNTCGKNCCAKIAWIDIATREYADPEITPSLGKTEPYLRALTKLYPSKAFETYFVPLVNVNFPLTLEDITTKDDPDPTAQDLVEAQQEWWEEYGPIFEDITELVDSLVKRGFEYIGIPASTVFQNVWFAGDVIPGHPLHGGRPIDLAYPGVKFLSVGINVLNGDALLYDNLWVFNDSISSIASTTIETSLTSIPTARGIPLSGVVYKLFLGASPALEETADFIESLFASGPLSEATFERILFGGYVNDASTYTAEDINQIASALCQNSRTFDLVVPIFLVGGANTFVTVVNEYDETATLPDQNLPCPENPPLFSQLYPNVVYFSLSGFPGAIPILGTAVTPDGPRVGVQIDFGIGTANGNPSIDQIKIGLPCDFDEYQAIVNLAFDPGYFVGYVWAANCQHVPQDVTGNPLRFHAGTRVVVHQFMWEAIAPPLSDVFGQQIRLAPLTNPLFCAGGALGH